MVGSRATGASNIRFSGSIPSTVGALSNLGDLCAGVCFGGLYSWLMCVILGVSSRLI